MIKYSLLSLLLLYYFITTAGGVTENSETSSVPSDCHHPKSVDSTVSVAFIKFEEVKFPLVISLFILITLLAKLGWHHPWMHFISSFIPESCMLIFVGAHVGGILVALFKLDQCSTDVFPFRFTPDTFFVYLLPPIVFASCYFLDNRAFFENIMTILIFAFIGTVWNAFALGFTIYGLSAASVMRSNFSVSSALLFGSINAAVDPVAVLAVFEEIHVNKLLHILVFGESLLNDAVVIVLFQVLGSFANIPFDTGRDELENQQAIDIVVGIFQFILVIIASMIIGFLMGVFGSLLSRFTQYIHVLEPVVVFIIGYLAYLLADLFAFSGIISLIVCSIIMKHYIPANFTWKSNITTKYCLKMISSIAEMVIFLFLGISLYDVDLHDFASLDYALIAWTVFFAILFRPLGVIVLTLLVNLFRFRKINIKQTFIMSYSGLRGAVAFSLALSRIFEEGAEYLPEEEKNLRKNMLTATTVLVLITVFIQGTTIKPLVKLIGVKLERPHKQTMNEVIHLTTIDHIVSGVEEITGNVGFNSVTEYLHHIDTKYIRKIFERFPEAIDREIMDKFNALQFKESQKAIECRQVIEHQEEAHKDNVPLIEPKEVTEPVTGDECVPALSEVLNNSRTHPHADHFMHLMSREMMEEQEHHFHKVKTSHRVTFHAKKGRVLRRHTTKSFGRNKDLDIALEEIATSSTTGLPQFIPESVKEEENETSNRQTAV